MSTTQKIDIRPATISDLRRDGANLLRQHYAELALDQRNDKLDPDWERYELLEDAGALLVLGAFFDDNLVGYTVTFIGPSGHYKGTSMAVNDVLFVAEGHRGGRGGLELIQATERAAKERGADVITWHAKEGTKLQELLPRIGYGVQDVVYSQRLTVREG